MSREVVGVLDKVGVGTTAVLLGAVLTLAAFDAAMSSCCRLLEALVSSASMDGGSSPALSLVVSGVAQRCFFCREGDVV